MGAMDGKVAIVTGGGRGIGRDECLLLAREGAKVVVNDVGAALDGSETGERPADEVVAEIRARGGGAVPSYDDVTHYAGAERLVRSAIDAFGRLDALVNNAGIVRDRMVYNMSEEDFDAVVAVHLKGHFNCVRWASAYFREENKKGSTDRRHIVNTTSGSGLLGNPGQTSYGAAKAGVAALTLIWARELERYGVSVNAIAPIARTRMTQATFGALEADAGEFDAMDPANVAPLVVYLASDLSNDVTGEVLGIRGGELERYAPWAVSKAIAKDGRWTVEEIAARAREVL